MRLKPRPFRKPRKGLEISKGLAGYWLMNEGDGNKVADLSGNDIFGSRLGTGNIWAGGLHGPTQEFNGSDDYISLGTRSEIFLDNDGTQAMSWAGWVYKNSGDSNWFAKQDNDANQTGWSIFSNSSHYFGLQMRAAANNRVLIIDDTAMTLKRWYFLVATYDGSKTLAGTNLYKDGVLITSFDTTQDNLVGSPSNSGTNTEARISSREDNTTEWNGFISTVMFWKRVLSATEIDRLYWNPFCMFDYDEIEQFSAATQGAGAPAGNAAIMTTNTGFWGPTF